MSTETSSSNGRKFLLGVAIGLCVGGIFTVISWVLSPVAEYPKASDQTSELAKGLAENTITIKAKIITAPMIAGEEYSRIDQPDSAMAFIARAEKDSPLQNYLPDDSSLICFSCGHRPLVGYAIAASLIERARITDTTVELKGCLINKGDYQGMFKLQFISAFNHCSDVREK